MNDLIIQREDLHNKEIDIEGRDIIIGFNEPKFKDLKGKKIDSKLNARLITYFLPAVEIARKQKIKPRLIIASGIVMALRYNANNEEEKKIMLANNGLKIDFLRSFFEKFYSNEFSLIEFIQPQDLLKVPEEKFKTLWQMILEKYPEEIVSIKLSFARYLYPKIFNQVKPENLSDSQKKRISQDRDRDRDSWSICLNSFICIR